MRVLGALVLLGVHPLPSQVGLSRSPQPHSPSVDPNDQKKTACYDIDVEVDDPLKAQMSNFLASTTNQQEIASLDAKVGGDTARGQLCPVGGGTQFL